MFNAKAYSGQYGTDKDVGDIVHLEIMLDDSPDGIMKDKEIILLIDVSASMSDTMKLVKSSLFAFRDALLNKSPQEMEAMSAEQRDTLFRNLLNVRVITFSNNAKEVWSNEVTETFENTIIKLNTEILTNMGDAIKLAFTKINPNKYTWIIIMTDGNSNQGPCRTASSFQRLVTSKPLNTKIVTLGYGDNFDPNVLNQVGNFVYVQNSEFIPMVLGNLAGEIVTTVGFNCTIDNSEMLPSEISDDTVIDTGTGKILVGNRVVGTLSSQKVYNYVYLMKNKLDKLTISYQDIITNEIKEVVAEIEYSNEGVSLGIPAGVRELYFKAETERLVYLLYKAIQSNKSVEIISKIKKILEEWIDPVCENYKEEILQLIQNSSKKNTANSALNYALGNGYSTTDLHGYVVGTSNASDYYMVSPLFNDN